MLIFAKSAAQRDWLCGLARRALPALTPTLQATLTPSLAAAPNTRLLLLDMDGVTATQRQNLLVNLQQQQLAERTLLFSAHINEALLQQMLAIGIAGYLLKSQSDAELHELLMHLASTPPLFAPPIWQHLLTHFRTTHPPTHLLTQRERDVLAAIGDGLTIPHVATRLTLSQNTVASYVKQIYRKLGIRNRAQAARVAMQLGLLPPERRP